MARSKRSKMLLEVITQADNEDQPVRGGFTAPAWWKSGVRPTDAREERTSGSARPAGRGDRAALLLQRLRRLRLTPTNAVVAIGGVAIVALAGIKFAGLRRRAPSDADLLAARDSQSIAELRNQPVRPDALDVIMGRTPLSPADDPGATLTSAATMPNDRPDATEKARAHGPGETASRLTGLNYVVVESFRGRDALADARSARNFLSEQGIAATVERVGSRYMLVTVRGFPSGDRELKEYCRRIEALGETYFASGGRYRFRGCYGKLYTADGW